jgi:hypothetical protein
MNMSSSLTAGVRPLSNTQKIGRQVSSYLVFYCDTTLCINAVIPGFAAFRDLFLKGDISIMGDSNISLLSRSVISLKILL